MARGRFLLAASILAAIGGTAAAADMPIKAAPLVVQREASGYVELYGGGAWAKESDTFCFSTCNSFSEKVNGWALGGAGRATYWWSPNASIQLDAQGEGTSYKFSSGNFSTRTSSHRYLIGGHANWRDPQRGLIGAFGGAGDTTFLGSSVRHGVIGAEAQGYWGMFTLYAQGGYNSTLGDVQTGVDAIHAWFVRGTARAYVNPNLRFEGTVLYANGGIDYNTGNVVPAGTFANFETWLWRAKVEHRFATAPFSIFAMYEGSQSSYKAGSPVPFQSDNLRITDNRVIGGIRLYLNERSLQWNDTNGTSLDIIAPLSVPSSSIVSPSVGQ